MHRIPLLLTALVMALALAACGGAQSKTSSSGGGVSTPRPTSSPSVAPSTPSSATSSQPVSTQACAGVALSLALGSVSAAGGHDGVVLTLRNNGSTSCQITGYPGVDGVLASGQRVSAQRTVSGYLGGIWGGSAQMLTLAPGQSASAMIEGIDNPNSSNGSTCPRFTSFLVTPPNTTATQQLTPPGGSFIYCQNALQVHPVVAGTSGQQRS